MTARWNLTKIILSKTSIENSAPRSSLSGRQKRRFAHMTEKNTDDDNNCCHDNFDQNFGNFDDNDDKNTEKPTNIVNFG